MPETGVNQGQDFPWIKSLYGLRSYSHQILTFSKLVNDF